MLSKATQAQHWESVRWRIKVIAEADPGVLLRILHPLQSRNIVPQSLRADRVGDDYVEVVVEIPYGALRADTVSLIVEKLAQVPTVLAAVASGE